MTAFRVTPAELMELSRQVHATAGSIESELGGLRSRVAPIGATWNGQAQERFQVLYEEWTRSAQGLQQALAEHYDVTVAANVKMTNSMCCGTRCTRGGVNGWYATKFATLGVKPMSSARTAVS